jgi:predicted DNA-binding transcriptional regulator AlpA
LGDCNARFDRNPAALDWQVARWPLIDATPARVDHLARTDPTFPQAVRLGGAFNSAKRWPEHEVLDWMHARLAARAADAANSSARGAALAKKSIAPDVIARRVATRRKRAQGATS